MLAVLKYSALFRIVTILCLLLIIFYSSKKYRTARTLFSLNTTKTPTILQGFARHELITNEGAINVTAVYYRHATSARNSSYPYISGDTFRAFADFLFDETRQDSLQTVKYGDVVFVKADMCGQFFGSPYESIPNPFVLITHNSDVSAPSNHKGRLEDKKILAWYASNPDIRSHPKVFPIPIGLANTRWPFGNLQKFHEAFQKYRKPWEQRTKLLYVNFSPDTNRQQRLAAIAQAKTIKNAHFVTNKITFETYLEDLGNTKFVLSPPGNGLDCHRTWEALLMGAAPVMISSGLDPLYENISAVIVNNWSDVTEERLSKTSFSAHDTFVPLVMYGRYWRDRVFRHRDKST